MKVLESQPVRLPDDSAADVALARQLIRVCAVQAALQRNAAKCSVSAGGGAGAPSAQRSRVEVTGEESLGDPITGCSVPISPDPSTTDAPRVKVPTTTGGSNRGSAGYGAGGGFPSVLTTVLTHNGAQVTLPSPAWVRELVAEPDLVFIPLALVRITDDDPFLARRLLVDTHFMSRAPPPPSLRATTTSTASGVRSTVWTQYGAGKKSTRGSITRI